MKLFTKQYARISSSATVTFRFTEKWKACEYLHKTVDGNYNRQAELFAIVNVFRQVCNSLL